MTAPTPGRRGTDRYRAVNNRLGWCMFVLASLIVLVHLFFDRPFTVFVVLLVLGLAFGGGALLQGISVDRVLRALRGLNGGTGPTWPSGGGSEPPTVPDPRWDP